MTQQKTRKISLQISYVLLILLLSIATVQSIQVSNAQNTTTNSKWALSLSIENGQNSSSPTFAPFDQIQLLSTVTYNNASQPDILVYFNVTGPIYASNPSKISRVGTTNSSGEAGFLFRLPIESENENSSSGTWLATATIQTTNGTITRKP